MKPDNELQKIENAEFTPEEIKQRFYFWLKQFYGGFTGFGDEITDKQIMLETKTATWTACLQFIRDKFIRNLQIKDGNATNSRINTTKLSILADTYIYFCNTYNKPQSAYGFCLLCDIDTQYIQTWVNGEGINGENNHIMKKIVQARREHMIGRVADGGAATIGAITLYNNEIVNSTSAETGTPEQNIAAIPRFSLENKG